jgi:hypothetical protein
MINKSNVDIISKALEEYWSYSYHDTHTINEINDARVRVSKIKEQMKKIGEIKICWG